MTDTIYCDVCDEQGGRHEDPYYPGEGYTVDMCGKCLRRQQRQAKIDARQVELDAEYARQAELDEMAEAQLVSA